MSYRRMGLPKLGHSLSRTFRGTTGLEDQVLEVPRTSLATWCAMFARTSNMVRRMPSVARDGFRPLRTSSTVCISWESPSSA
jgi:hypothetical protein